MLRPEHCWYALVLAFKDGNTIQSHSWGQPLSFPEEALKLPCYKSCGYQKTQGLSATHIPPHPQSPDYSLLGLLTVHKVPCWFSPHLERRGLLFLPHHQLSQGQVQNNRGCFHPLDQGKSHWLVLTGRL